MRLVPALFFLMIYALPVRAAPELCETAALQAAAESGVPADLLMAVALAETGLRRGDRRRPWPWAVNREGHGQWLESRAALEAFATSSVRSGRVNFDIGCFQINWRWHGQHFSHPTELVEPLANARYAARLLTELKHEFGDWEAASGAFHSRTPERGARYAARVAALRPEARRIMASAPDHVAPTTTPGSSGTQRITRAGSWPMPNGAVPGAQASLVPGSLPSRPFLNGLPP